MLARLASAQSRRECAGEQRRPQVVRVARGAGEQCFEHRRPDRTRRARATLRFAVSIDAVADPPALEGSAPRTVVVQTASSCDRRRYAVRIARVDARLCPIWRRCQKTRLRGSLCTAITTSSSAPRRAVEVPVRAPPLGPGEAQVRRHAKASRRVSRGPTASPLRRESERSCRTRCRGAVGARACPEMLRQLDACRSLLERERKGGHQGCALKIFHRALLLRARLRAPISGSRQCFQVREHRESPAAHSTRWPTGLPKRSRSVALIAVGLDEPLSNDPAKRIAWALRRCATDRSS